MFHPTDNSQHLGQTCSDSLSGLSYELFCSAGLTNFPIRSVEVSPVTVPPKRTTVAFFTVASKQSCQNIENETTANEGEVGAGWVIKMLGEGLIKLECPILFSAPPTFYFTSLLLPLMEQFRFPTNGLLNGN